MNSKMTAEEAISHIESLFPPDSRYDDTAATGRLLLEIHVGLKADPNKWRDLPEQDLIKLAEANLVEDGLSRCPLCGSYNTEAKGMTGYNQVNGLDVEQDVSWIECGDCNHTFDY